MEREQYQESIFFRALYNAHKKFLIQAAAERLFICVPQSCSLRTTRIGEKDIGMYIYYVAHSPLSIDFTHSFVVQNIIFSSLVKTVENLPLLEGKMYKYQELKYLVYLIIKKLYSRILSVAILYLLKFLCRHFLGTHPVLKVRILNSRYTSYLVP